jgi:hypothetical protein
MNQIGSFFRNIYMLRQPQADLYDRIIKKIDSEEKLKILKRRLILESLSLLIWVVVFIPLMLKLLSDLASSGIIQFLSLLTTDFNVIMVNIGDYVLSLIESMPALSLSLTLATLLIFMFNLAKLADSYSDFKKINFKLKI